MKITIMKGYKVATSMSINGSHRHAHQSSCGLLLPWIYHCCHPVIIFEKKKKSFMLTLWAPAMAESHLNFLHTRDQLRLTEVQGNFSRNLILGPYMENICGVSAQVAFVMHIITCNFNHPHWVFCSCLLVGVGEGIYGNGLSHLQRCHTYCYHLCYVT